MKNYILPTLFVLTLAACNNEVKKEKSIVMDTTEQKESSDQKKPENIYQFSVTDLYGDTFDFSSVQGKKIMIVNTASKCGFTPQYEDLQKLYDTYKDKNFVIVGFPANNFGQQEPGTDKEIAAFCKENYGVSFPMMSKISVKGDDMHNVYQFLTQKDKNGFADSEVAWNFQKYLLNEKGELVRVVESKILPTDTSIISWIEEK
jgi:glutathione peroxidase